MNLVVGGTTDNNEVPSNTGKTWGSVFKWKPPEDNSIDFLVKLDKRKYVKNVDPSSGQVRYIATCGLFVTGFRDDMCELMYKEFNTTNMGEIPFQPANPPMNDSAIMKLFVDHASSYPKTKEGDSIENNTIVECRYEIDKQEGFRWVPMRVRYDKTAAYKSSRKDRKTLSMNFVDTANSIWELTHFPITRDMVTSGIFNISEDEMLNQNVQDGAYYNRVGTRQESRMLTLQRFHNDIIKRKMMIEKYVEKGGALLDLACGKGGDLYKWINAEVGWVMGVDINNDNIHNGKDGICSRYVNIRNRRRGDIPPMAFVVCDSAKPINELRSYDNEFDRMVVNNIFNGVGAPKFSLLEKLQGKAAEGFDVIEMMFAIHYLMKDKSTLDAFMKNVTDNIKPGGIFMFNSLNGKRVHRLLRDTDYYRGRLETDPKNQPSLWEIKKHYGEGGGEGEAGGEEGVAGDLADDETCLGKKISVYVETINNVFEEYLVNYEYLEVYLREKGFEKVEQHDFEDIHAGDDNREKYPMTRFEREYSYLHTFAVYRKVA
jgi:2-polyprenyl-3-methyl-5-hydroxy-6-metoxy-1,4-benzoquinol methylase